MATEYEHYYLILDCVTDAIGSFMPPEQKLLQLGFILIDNNFDIMIKYEKYNNEISQIGSFHDDSITYISNNGIKLEQMLNDLNNILVEYNPTIVSHNAKFCIGIIKHAGLEINCDVLCTMETSSEYIRAHGGNYIWMTMEKLGRYFKIPVMRKYAALSDCEDLLRIFIAGKRKGVF